MNFEWLKVGGKGRLTNVPKVLGLLLSSVLYKSNPDKCDFMQTIYIVTVMGDVVSFIMQQQQCLD